MFTYAILHPVYIFKHATVTGVYITMFIKCVVFNFGISREDLTCYAAD